MIKRLVWVALFCPLAPLAFPLFIVFRVGVGACFPPPPVISLGE